MPTETVKIWHVATCSPYTQVQQRFMHLVDPGDAMVQEDGMLLVASC